MSTELNLLFLLFIKSWGLPKAAHHKRNDLCDRFNYANSYCFHTCAFVSCAFRFRMLCMHGNFVISIVLPTCRVAPTGAFAHRPDIACSYASPLIGTQLTIANNCRRRQSAWALRILERRSPLRLQPSQRVIGIARFVSEGNDILAMTLLSAVCDIGVLVQGVEVAKLFTSHGVACKYWDVPKYHQRILITIGSVYLISHCDCACSRPETKSTYCIVLRH